MDNFDDFELDDNIFESDAGINKITEAYAKVFDNLLELSEKGKAFSESGSTKEISSTINKIASKVAALVQISEYDKKIVNSNGTIFNVFGKELNSSESNSDETITESELVEELNKIIEGCSSIGISDMSFDSDKNKNNIEDDGSDHGDLDFIW